MLLFLKIKDLMMIYLSCKSCKAMLVESKTTNMTPKMSLMITTLITAL